MALIQALLLLLAPGVAVAQSSASPFTYGVRYDVERRVVGTIAPDPDGAGPLRHAAVRNSYDARGCLTRVETGELANWQGDAVAPAAWAGFTVFGTAEITCDLEGRKLREAVSAGGAVQRVVEYRHDAAGRVVCEALRMDPAAWGTPLPSPCLPGPAGPHGPDRVTVTSYDAAGRVLRVRKAVGTPLEQDYAAYSYGGNGQLLSVTDANGARAQMEYDGLDRRIRWRFPSRTTSGVTSADDYEEYGYDPAGNRTSLRKRDGRVIGFGYDQRNRVILKDLPPGAGDDVHYAYDNRGLQLFARFGSAAGPGVETAYDNLGRPLTATQTLDGVARTLSYQYDRHGNRLQVTHPDGVAVTYEWDGLDRSSAVRVNGEAVAAYRYDSQGRRDRQDRGNGTFVTYSYDPAGRLAGIADDLGGGTAADVTYGLLYNPASQVIERTRSNDLYGFTQEVNVERPYTVNGLNQYVRAGALTFGYDAKGNLASDGRTAFGYNIENRLVSAAGALTAALRYDPMGRLYETSGGPAGATRFLYDGDELVAEYTAAGALVRRHVHGAGVDDPIVWYEGAGLAAPAWLSTDHQGSVTAHADGAGALLGLPNRYNSWGIPETTNRGRFSYTGQAWIPELRILHYKARIYSPTLGRFLQTDPVGYDDQINLYSYVGNDPVNKTDPDGQVIDTIAGVAFIAYDVYAIATEGATTTNVAALGADVVAAVVPGVTGAGAAVRASAKGADAVRAERSAKVQIKATAPYSRPSGATTQAQRASVQGKPCVKCGATTPTQRAGHKEALVKEHYEKGSIDKGRR